MPPQKTPLKAIHQTILELLTKNPEGLDIRQIRDLGKIEGQQHLDKRIRELYPFYEIATRHEGRRYVYKLIKKRDGNSYDYSEISKTLKAKVFQRYGRRCRMCGKTVDEDFVKLHIDHKVPREWGGLTSEENLWVLCSGCNEGKRNYFASFDPELMNTVLRYASVHRRIAEILRLKMGEWVDCDLIEFVANFDDYQEDWKKRLRELRYFNFQIVSRNRKIGRRTLSFYRLNNWPDNQPEDLTAAAREYEKQRAAANKAKKKPNS